MKGRVSLLSSGRTREELYVAKMSIYGGPISLLNDGEICRENQYDNTNNPHIYTLNKHLFPSQNITDHSLLQTTSTPSIYGLIRYSWYFNKIS